MSLGAYPTVPSVASLTVTDPLTNSGTAANPIIYIDQTRVGAARTNYLGIKTATFEIFEADFASYDMVMVFLDVQSAAGNIAITIPAATALDGGKVLAMSWSETNTNGRTVTVTPSAGTITGAASLALGALSAVSVSTTNDTVGNWWRAS